MAYIPQSGSVVAFEGTNPWIVTGSVQGSFSPSGNQSVSGTVNVGNLPTTQNVSGSVVATQGTNPWIITGSVQASLTPAANQSVSGTVGSSVIGTVPVTQVTNPWTVVSSITGGIFPISGSVAATVTNFPTTQNVSGSVAATVTNTVTVVSSIAGGIFPISGSVAATVTNFPTTQNVSGSVVATQGTTPWIIGSIYGNIAGSVAATVTNTVTVVSSIAGGIFPISGSVAATIVGTPNVNTAGSVVAFQGGAPWANTNVGSVITVGQGSIAVAIISGSIAASFTPPANQSVSGTVQTDVRGSVATVIIGGSIAASFTPPANQSVSGTVQTDVRASVAVVIIGGSVATATTNSSVMLLSGANTIGSVTALQGTNPWIITGSVQASITPAANQSVSGTVGASIIGVVPVTQSGTLITSISGIVNVSGSIAGTYTEPAVATSVTGLAMMFKTNISTSTMGVISATNPLPINGSVSGSVGIAGNVTINSPSVYGNISGSVVAFQGAGWSGSVAATVTNTVTVVSSIAGGIFPISGSVAATITNTNLNVSGSVAAWLNSSNASVITVGTPVANQSVSGTVGASIIGLTPVNVTNTNLNIAGSIAGTYANSNVASTVTGVAMMFKQNVSSSIMTEVSPTFPLPVSVQGVIQVTGNPSISGTVQVGNFPTTQNVSGSVVATQGTTPWVVVGSVYQGTGWSGSVAATVTNTVTVVSSIAGGIFPVSGSVAAVITNTNVNVSGSVAAWLNSSSASVITLNQGSSILAVPVGSVITVAQGSVAAAQIGTRITSVSGTLVVASLVGTFAEDSAHTSGDPGLFVLGIRNDTVASLVSVDKDYGAFTTDSAGRNLIKPFAPDEVRLDTQTSVVSGSVTALFNSVLGLRNYVTDVFVANTGSVATLVTFTDGSTSVLGYTIAPAGGGSNIIGMAMPFRTAPSQDFTFSMAPSTSILYVSAKGYKAP